MGRAQKINSGGAESHSRGAKKYAEPHGVDMDAIMAVKEMQRLTLFT